jgi:tartrate dehydrogenase/decarboxylase/D-malate dehydrogenase
MMLDHLGEHVAAKAITDSIEECLISGPATPDLGGTASTSDVGQAIANSFG